MNRPSDPAKPHEGFKQRLIDRAAEKTRKFKFLKQIALSPHFLEVEAAIDNAKKGRGGVSIDQAWLVQAIEEAHAHYLDKFSYLPLKAKTQKPKKALENISDLLDYIEREAPSFNHSPTTKQLFILERAIRERILQITEDHCPYLSGSRTQGLAKEQIMFCFWLKVWLFKRYPQKQFSTLIASIASCLFADADRITGERVKNTLANASREIEKKAAEMPPPVRI